MNPLNNRDPLQKKGVSAFRTLRAPGAAILIFLLFVPFLVYEDKKERAANLAAQESRQEQNRQEQNQPNAHGNPVDRVDTLVEGSDRQIPGGASVCYDKESALHIAGIHNTEGYDAANKIFKKYRKERRCFNLVNVAFTVGVLIDKGSAVNVVTITNIVLRETIVRKKKGGQETATVDHFIGPPMAYLLSTYRWVPRIETQEKV